MALLFQFPVQNSVPDAFHGGLVIVCLHRFERAFQFVHQFWIKFAHTEGEFHTDGLNARILLDIHHVFEAEIEEVRPQIIFRA